MQLDTNDTHHILTNADDANLIGDSVRTVENTDVLLNTCKGIGLVVNVWGKNEVHGSRTSLEHDGK